MNRRQFLLSAGAAVGLGSLSFATTSSLWGKDANPLRNIVMNGDVNIKPTGKEFAYSYFVTPPHKNDDMIDDHPDSLTDFLATEMGGEFLYKIENPQEIPLTNKSNIIVLVKQYEITGIGDNLRLELDRTIHFDTAIKGRWSEIINTNVPPAIIPLIGDDAIPMKKIDGIDFNDSNTISFDRDSVIKDVDFPSPLKIDDKYPGFEKVSDTVFTIPDGKTTLWNATGISIGMDVNDHMDLFNNVNVELRLRQVR